MGCMPGMMTLKRRASKKKWVFFLLLLLGMQLCTNSSFYFCFWGGCKSCLLVCFSWFVFLMGIKSSCHPFFCNFLWVFEKLVLHGFLQSSNMQREGGKGGVFFVSSVQLQYKGIEEGDVFWLLDHQEAVLCQSSVIFIGRFGSLLVT